jgi:hypothetical protein
MEAAEAEAEAGDGDGVEAEVEATGAEVAAVAVTAAAGVEDMTVDTVGATANGNCAGLLSFPLPPQGCARLSFLPSPSHTTAHRLNYVFVMHILTDGLYGGGQLPHLCAICDWKRPRESRPAGG